MNYWLLKSEPSTYAFAELVADTQTLWTGVRNYTARLNLRAMKKGDLCLYFHSGPEKAVVGVAKVAGPPEADPTAPGEDWTCVLVKPVKALKEPVALKTLKATPALAKMEMIRQSRLSVSPLTKKEFDAVLKLGKTPV